jgi:hypothetical protein
VKPGTRRALAGSYLGAFGIHIFGFLMVMEAFSMGNVPVLLPILMLFNALLCLYGAGINAPKKDDD